MRFGLFVAFAVVVGLSAGCLEHLDPSRVQKSVAEEQKVANAPLQRLTAKGELPPAGGEAIDGDAVYNQFCAACHGANGAADSASAQVMNPKPRNFTDKAWQASVNDEHLVKVIKSGGGAVGLSATMPGWGGQLNEAQINAMVKKVRNFGS
jgi:mono/diheme cytochrome c family protein